MFDWQCVMHKSDCPSAVASERMVRSLAVHPGMATLMVCLPNGWCSHLASPTTETNKEGR
jgi:hypothetical protein